MMKLLVLLAVGLVLANALTEEHKAQARAIMQKCIASTGVTKEMAEKARGGDDVTDPKVYLFSKCGFKENNFYNDADELQRDVIIARLTAFGDTDAATHYDACLVYKDDTDAGKSAYKLSRCLHKNIKNYWKN